MAAGDGGAAVENAELGNWAGGLGRRLEQVKGEELLRSAIAYHNSPIRQRKRLRISIPLPHSERKSRVFLLLCSLAMTWKIFSPCSHSEGGEE